MRHTIYIIGIAATLWLLADVAWSQISTRRSTELPDSSARKIYLIHARTLTFDQQRNPDRQELHGEVVFRQDSAYLYCDKAYFYRLSNRMEAYGNVRMEQGDSLYLFCDSLTYDGNDMLARCMDRVYLFHNNTILSTDYLLYDRSTSEAYYPEGGYIVDPNNHLLSTLGWYYPNQKRALFQYDVQLRNYEYPADTTQTENLQPEELVENTDTTTRPFSSVPVSLWRYPSIRDSLLSLRRPPHMEDYPDDRHNRPRMWLYSDTLSYDFGADRAQVLGPSRIFNDSATVHTTRGVYNTKMGDATLYRRSDISSRGRYATGDRMTYNIRTGLGEGWGNVIMIDSISKGQLHGDHVLYSDFPRKATITDRALAMEYSSGDTLWLHADTLRTFQELRPVMAKDSMGQLTGDTLRMDTLNFMTAHFNVRYFRRDLQGICDSLNYNAFDSLATFVGNPVMWNGLYQITGDSIIANVDREGIHTVWIHDNAFLVQQHDTLHYDQISGQKLICYFDSSEVRKMDISGSVQTIFYPEEKDHTLIGLNQVIGTYLTIWFKKRKMDHLAIWPEPVGSLTPLQLVQSSQLYLDKFRWMEYLRPTDPDDVFRDIRMKETDKQEVVKLFDDNELNGYE